MLRGLETRHEQDPRLLLRDTRTIGQRMRDFFAEPRNIGLIIVVAAVAVFFFPSVADIIFILVLIIFFVAIVQKTKLPFRLPLRSGLKDYNDIRPGSNKPNRARGIYYFGNDRVTNEELWFSNDDMRTHVLIFGSTGSGKTEGLISIAYNSLIQGSGFIYVDGKGDNALFSKVFSMARSLGRADDMLLINFMTGARDIVGPQERRLSNTLNPFANGSSSMLSQLVISLMDSSSSGDSSGDMWKGRAIGFVEALMRILVYMRDDEKILLDANVIRNYFSLQRLEAITMDKLFMRDGQEPVSCANVPALVLEPIYNYVVNLPGYNKEKKGKQVSQVLEQHGFITMQLTRVFTSLADTYGHILRTNLAEVDVKDVVLNRRILVVLLPALEKSPEELANLGKIIVASLKAMMASGLGEEVEGTYKEIIAKKPTNAPTPYLCILDEYGYYAVPGFAVVPAQARSLGFSAIFAGQDLPAFQKASKEEALSIGANTNIKIAMKLEDPIETWDFFQKTAGEAYVTKVDAFQTNQGMMNAYMDTKSASAERRQRIDLLDLKDQREGEMHIFFKSKIVRAKIFYANPPPVAKMRLNHFLKVGVPDIKSLVALEKNLEAFADLLEKQDFDIALDDSGSQELETIINAYKDADDKPLLEKGVDALLAFYQATEGPAEEEVQEEFTIDEAVNELTIYLKPQLTDVTKSLVSADQQEIFGAPILIKSQVKPKLDMISRLVGRGGKYSSSVTREVMNDTEVATRYPPAIVDPISAKKISELIKTLAKSFGEMNGDD
jgi:intracellular multiplication protein IcmO